MIRGPCITMFFSAGVITGDIKIFNFLCTSLSVAVDSKVLILSFSTPARATYVLLYSHNASCVVCPQTVVKRLSAHPTTSLQKTRPLRQVRSSRVATLSNAFCARRDWTWKIRLETCAHLSQVHVPKLGKDAHRREIRVILGRTVLD